MILYLDSSALVKLYFNEEGRDTVTMAVEASEGISTSTIAYAETRATLARKYREGWLDNNGYYSAVADLNDDWLAFELLNVTPQLAYRAGEVAQQYALRGFDAVHLASALTFAERLQNLKFLAFDKRLNDAARAASLTVYGDTLDAG